MKGKKGMLSFARGYEKKDIGKTRERAQRKAAGWSGHMEKGCPKRGLKSIVIPRPPGRSTET